MFIVSKVFWFILFYKFCYCIFLFCIKAFSDSENKKPTPVIKSTSSSAHIVRFVHSPYSTTLPLKKSSTYEHILLFFLFYIIFLNFHFIFNQNSPSHTSSYLLLTPPPQHIPIYSSQWVKAPMGYQQSLTH